MNRDLAGGVYTDFNRQVLDTQRNVIEGLFAVGFSSSRDLYAIGIPGASSVGEAVVTGRVAESYLAQELNNNPSSRSFLKTGPPENSPAVPFLHRAVHRPPCAPATGSRPVSSVWAFLLPARTASTTAPWG